MNMMYQMPNKLLDELPKTLRCMIEALLDTGKLISWNIRSGDNFTSLNIRFSCEDTIHNLPKVPPSRLARSRQRHDNYRRMVEEDQNIDICAINLDGDGSDNLDSMDTVKTKTRRKDHGNQSKRRCTCAR